MKKIEFCYNIKNNRWYIQNHKDLKPIIEEAINSSLDLMEDEYSDESCRIQFGNLKKFTRRQQIKLLKRLRLAVFEEGNCIDDEDHILEELLYNTLTTYVEVIGDMKNGDHPNAKKEWKKIKDFCSKELDVKALKESEIFEFFSDNIWHDLDFQYVSFDKEYINNYKSIIKGY
jgi:hypothetical protein